MKRFFLAVAGVAFLSVAAPGAQTPEIDKGKALYDQHKCSTCHVIAGKGTPKIASALDGVGKKLPAGDLKKWLTDTAAMEAKLAKKPMVKMSDFMKAKKFNDAEVTALVAYLQSLK
jgi:mono/diheme cytochrome c family protein